MHVHVQCVVWGIMPMTVARSSNHVNHTISLLIILQYIPRLIIIFPLNWRIIKNTGVVAKTAWTGAAYNLILYLLASHVSNLYDSVVIVVSVVDW